MAQLNSNSKGFIIPQSWIPCTACNGLGTCRHGCCSCSVCKGEGGRRVTAEPLEAPKSLNNRSTRAYMLSHDELILILSALNIRILSGAQAGHTEIRDKLKEQLEQYNEADAQARVEDSPLPVSVILTMSPERMEELHAELVGAGMLTLAGQLSLRMQEVLNHE